MHETFLEKITSEKWAVKIDKVNLKQSRTQTKNQPNNSSENIYLNNQYEMTESFVSFPKFSPTLNDA